MEEEKSVQKKRPSLAFLNSMKNFEKQKLKSTKTKVQTRDGKIHIEGVDKDGNRFRIFKGVQALPKFLSEEASKVKSLTWASFNDGDEKEGKWTNVEKNLEPPAEGPQELVVVSYNVWFDTYEKKKRMIALLAMLEKLRPHIFCLQEVTESFLEYMLSLGWIRKEYFVSDRTKATVFPYGVLIATRLIPIELDICWLPSNMGRKLVRGRAWTSSNEKIEFSTAHFESLNNTEYRCEQLDLFFKEYTDPTETYKTRLLMGDFNFDADQGPEERHIPESWVDCWKSCKKSDKYGYTGTFRGRYDRILCNSALWEPKEFSLLGTKRLPGASRGRIQTPSDHFGIKTRFLPLKN